MRIPQMQKVRKRISAWLEVPQFISGWLEWNPQVDSCPSLSTVQDCSCLSQPRICISISCAQWFRRPSRRGNVFSQYPTPKCETPFWQPALWTMSSSCFWLEKPSYATRPTSMLLLKLLCLGNKDNGRAQPAWSRAWPRRISAKERQSVFSFWETCTI